MVSRLIILACVILAGFAPAVHAEESVCAVVKIEIEQEVTFERQGFEAKLDITNGLKDQSLDDIQVDVQFRDAEGNEVLASSDPDNTDALFFIDVDRVEGVSEFPGGSLAPEQEGSIRWRIIPAPGAASEAPNGVRYFVGALLSYERDGEVSEVTVTHRDHIDPIGSLVV